MQIKNRIVVLLFRIALVAGCAYGMAVSSGVFRGGYTSKMLAYYTNLSNIACFAYMFFATVHTIIEIIRKGVRGSTEFLPWLKKALTMAITVTLLVYHFILAPTVYRMNLNYEIYSLPDILIHYFTPIMVILDWLLFDEKNRVRWYNPLQWLSLPVAYFGYVLIRAEISEPLNAIGTRYPYFFIDLDELSTAETAGNVLLCIAGFAALGYVFFLIDKLPLLRARNVAKSRDTNIHN